MQITIPPVAMVRNRLGALDQGQVRQLAKDSGVPFGTLMKIRHGITSNPGIDTVGKFWPLLSAQTGEHADHAVQSA